MRYATGYSKRLDTAVRQNILWGIKQCNQNTADMVGEEFGADGYEISYHSNSRPSHSEMGGKQYAKLCEAGGLPTKVDRMNVKGFRSVKAESTPVGQAKYKTIVNKKIDEKQHKKYIDVLGEEFVPKTVDEFQKIKYNNIDKWNVLKQQYRIVNQYKVDSGEVSVQKILELDRTIIFEKRNNFPSGYKKSGNIAGAYIDTENILFLSHSRIDDTVSKGYKNYKGHSNIVLLQKERQFEYIDVLKPDGSMRTNTYVDTEAKLFEEFHLLLQTNQFSEITMLSERGMCESCKGVMEQFKRMHPDIRVNVVSNKKVNANVWKYRLRK